MLGAETTLYPPVKRFLESLGFEVKGEVCGCDVVALDKGVPASVVIAELKLNFTLDLLLQAVDRLPACDDVWLAVRASRRGRGRERDSRVRKLCRLLGFGLVAVSAKGNVEVIIEPVPWRPRRDPKRRSRIVEEHRKRRRGSSNWRQYAPAHHDRLPTAGTRLCQGAGGSAEPAARSQGNDAGCGKDSAAQCLRVV
jgi:hypothetical protein